MNDEEHDEQYRDLFSSGVPPRGPGYWADIRNALEAIDREVTAEADVDGENRDTDDGDSRLINMFINSKSRNESSINGTRLLTIAAALMLTLLAAGVFFQILNQSPSTTEVSTDDGTGESEEGDSDSTTPDDADGSADEPDGEPVDDGDAESGSGNDNDNDNESDNEDEDADSSDDGSTDGGSTDTAELPGEAWEGVLQPGAVLGVIGVQADDVLNIRALPGAGEDLVATYGPLERGLVFTGRGRLIGDPGSVWYEIDTGTTTGWVNARFVAPLAGTVDATSLVLERAGEIPTGETVQEIADIVIDGYVGDDPIEGELRIVMVDGPHEGDLIEVTFDVIGYPDDSVAGDRLHIFITPAEEAGGLMSLKSVEATAICQRGSGESDLCP